ncbi:hypothetical protein VOLCADRAFT_92767 [Volvox carteri f. nagariensis]|uniref:Uncharacterized protein n=1 Tax=Volvox carteri f. nagariensis TaxID=3068 RepID=D8U0X0_VOLCA|nr:uncharacterized protein VOLCADRAFT_92767 [Volvox carteri f. nagariensis]EFJ46623.1 hypothetical protein VOLCADRAFT_92767 [Volvox carteri f. nagariensis]|eukprot:XP_002952152.1 hypothetical protein VOLCADRAFT_92767 [Volvox carteri f. nagariensis]
MQAFVPMTNGSTSYRQPASLHGGNLHNRSAQQRGGMAPPGPPPYGYPGQQIPGSPTSGSSPRSPTIPPIVLEASSSRVGTQTCVQLLVPSRQALYAVLAVPLLLWLVVMLAGTLHSEPIPDGFTKRDFEHPLTWFDSMLCDRGLVMVDWDRGIWYPRRARPGIPVQVDGKVKMLLATHVNSVHRTVDDVITHVFRVWGPMLPLAPYLVRVASLGLQGRAPAPSLSDSKPLSRPLCPGVTLPLQTLFVYLTIILLRLVIYVGHVALQRWSTGALVLVSDHLLLAASVVACFQSELVMCLSDVYKSELLRGMDQSTDLRQLVVVGGFVVSMFAMVFIFGDMYCTARWYHHATESWAAVFAGALLFQAPVVVWLLRRNSCPTQFARVTSM